VLAQPKCLGWVQPGLKKLKKKIFWAEIGPTILGRWPTSSWAELGPVSWAGPAHIFNIILYYIIFKKNEKNSKKISKIFKKFVIFSNIFLPVLHNIGLYIYTVKYKSGIKIPGFL
jgi:hypothetical protein